MITSEDGLQYYSKIETISKGNYYLLVNRFFCGKYSLHFKKITLRGYLTPNSITFHLDGIISFAQCDL